MEDYNQARRTRTQNEVEIESLRLLWTGTIRTFTPELPYFQKWLRLTNYAAATSAINSVARFFIKRDGMLQPGALIRAMDRNIADIVTHLNKVQQ